MQKTHRLETELRTIILRQMAALEKQGKLPRKTWDIAYNAALALVIAIEAGNIAVTIRRKKAQATKRENQCPGCGADCHRATDAQWGSGNRPIPIYGRTGRKLREVYCENGCSCEECNTYWNEQ
jgi:hypothetical protein